MKINGTDDLSNVKLYDPFVHFFSEDGNNYVEVLVMVPQTSSLQSAVKEKKGDTLIVVVNVQEGSPTTENKIIYSNRISLPGNESPDVQVIIMVVHGDPEEGGTAIVRYRDI